MKQEALLNERVTVRVAPSKIHGVGVFALRDLPKGKKMELDAYPEKYTLPYSSFGKLFPEVRELLLERNPAIVKGSHFIYPDTRFMVYMNHSETPNYDGKNDVTLKAIKKGEELTEDYREIEGWDSVYNFIDKS